MTTTTPTIADLNAAAAQLATNERTVAQSLMSTLQGLSTTLTGLQGQLPAYDASVTGQAMVQLASMIASQMTYMPQRITALTAIIDAQTAAASTTTTTTTTTTAS